MLSINISERRLRPEFPTLAVKLAATVILTEGLLNSPPRRPVVFNWGRLSCNLGRDSLLTVIEDETDGLNWPATILKGGDVVGADVVVDVVVVGWGVVDVVVGGAGVVTAHFGVPNGTNKHVA